MGIVSDIDMIDRAHTRGVCSGNIQNRVDVSVKKCDFLIGRILLCGTDT